jgi:hypothetical protein
VVCNLILASHPKSLLRAGKEGKGKIEGKIVFPVNTLPTCSYNPVFPSFPFSLTFCLRARTQQLPQAVRKAEPTTGPEKSWKFSNRDDRLLLLLNDFVQSHQSQPFLLFSVEAVRDALPVVLNG